MDAALALLLPELPPLAGSQDRGAGAPWSCALPLGAAGPSAAAGLILRGDTPRDAAAGPGRMVAGTDAAWSWMLFWVSFCTS